MNDLEQLATRVAEIEKVIENLNLSDRYQLKKNLQLLDGRNVVLGGTQGTKVGTANTQKLGFFGGRSGGPVVQPTADTVNAATNVYSTSFFAGATYGNAEKNMLNNIWNALIGLGLIREI